MQKITPCLWFDSNAEQAANFYVSVFKNSKITSISRYDDQSAEVSGKPKGSVLTVGFSLDGQDFMALNGGSVYKINEAISFVVNVNDQKELDYYWDKLTEGGEVIQCGWLKDKYGVTWQVVPTILEELLHGKDPEKSEKVMAAMLEMKKLDIATLRRAYE